MRPCPVISVGAYLIHVISIPDRGVAERRKRQMIGRGVREAIFINEDGSVTLLP